tara:strand:- start:14 stop:577 length:564 start_codon:yes stop_codon:yes gene_type:complete
MASIFITYGLLGFPFLFGLMEDSAVNDRKNAAGAVIGKKHSYWDWVLLGFSISLGIFVLRYIRATIKWKETKQYILKKLGTGVDPGSSEALESSFGYYWKSTLFFPAWFLNYFFFPQSGVGLALSYLFCGFLFWLTLYYLLTSKYDGKGFGEFSRSGALYISIPATIGLVIFSILFGAIFTLGKSGS